MNQTRSSLNLAALACLLFVAALPEQSFAAQTEVAYLSGQGKDDAVPWEFYCTGGRNSGKWTTIPVPSNWELQGFGTYNYGHDRTKSDEQGKYRRHFEVSEAWANKRIFIVFEGVMTDTDVAVNERPAGPQHQGGFYRFKHEITDLVKTGDNLLEVTVSKVSANQSVELAERAADYWVFGGIYRPVYLQAVPRQFIDWTAIDAKADGTFSIDVYLNGLSAADTVRAQIVGPDGKQLCEPFEAKVQPEHEKVALTTKVSGHQAWTAETPNLYQVRVTLLQGETEIHTATERFGFRTFEVRPSDGLYLNGQKIRLKGANRHSFWPDSGRCLSRQISYDDVRLIKEMNMNSVRMSHYPPDVHFLEACDELGLYVLDELAGWQKPSYDTEVGKKLVKEMVTRDVSHPCILFWDNGNEGGWNRTLDDEFALYDPQKRTVLHPWESFNGLDTDHYESYESTKKKLAGSTLFMPTEFLHGLYDGGHGAGLNDYWNLMHSSPLGAGGFLWALVDEGVVRTDKDGQIDVMGSLAPDGIVGPYRQKEASFYTIKEIWSPVQIALERLGEDFSGQLEVENRFDFTNLRACIFEVKLGEFPGPWEDAVQPSVSFLKTFRGPDVEPHGSGSIDLELPENWRQADVLYLTAQDPTGNEIWTWSWDIGGHDRYREKYVETKTQDETEANAIVRNNVVHVEAGDTAMKFDVSSGELTDLKVNGKSLSFSGPKIIGGTMKKLKLTCMKVDDNIVLDTKYEGNMNYARWTVYPAGWIKLEYEFELQGQLSLFGIDFDYPEGKMKRMRWLGTGPYRVWRNRTKGGRLGIWSNNYKDDIPGETWDFPEFKGYYHDWRWATFTTEEANITIINGTNDLYLGVYRPNDGPDPKNTKLNVPDSGIALLHGIPPIGTKFLRPERMGPESQKNTASGKHKGTVYLRFSN